MTFYDREEELDTLTGAVESPGSDFVVVYGRRRVGKTELLKEFCADRPHIYFLAAQEAEHRQREKFLEQVADYFDERVPRIDSWDEAFEYLGENLQREDLVVVIDEFPYLVEENDSLPSYIQAFVDQALDGTDSMLVLCGSSVSTMESEILGHESPLYGRRTAQLDVTPFSFQQAREVISYNITDAVRSYAVTGGTPMYLTLFDYDQSLAANIRSHVLSSSAVLYNEPEFLLRTELRNPARYMSILEAVALGHTTPNEISGATGIDSGPLSKYLQTLRRLRLIERDVPVTASGKKSKRSRYRVADEFLRFWFRYVEPHRSSIEEAPEIVYDGTIEPDLPTHVATTFEDVCQEAVWEGIRRGAFEPYSEVGRWWYGEEEIDIVGLAPNDDRVLLAECKWTTDPVGEDLVKSLRAKAEHVRWGPSDRDEQFALFSKSGFVDGLEAQLDDSWSLFTVADIDDLLTPS
ncbi:AAA+ superfamily ATPase fused to HTH and RecB nuclease domains [Halalkaliarchaeum sp. AArc-CO]|uniref:ATP-binding protein n=1 Tax=Halalkaliarchaeum sp. AArc-CO TaxID=2866381 RepID=UPI00217EBDC0|nr:ATP-binding protein [Halalkaliarchaeum sp. AArc-CO]UWG50680.1 AAA+ superfamily ATPase fused to HTH and RecB nuclease domains [Halalkaliarchaeum sp. AArc-CO]